MRHEEFLSALQRPTFSWQMARGVVASWLPAEQQEHPLVRSGRTRMRRAQAEIDRIVLQRARAVCAEHDHGPYAGCSWLCDLTPEDREAYRTAIRSEPDVTNEKAAEIKARFGG